MSGRCKLCGAELDPTTGGTQEDLLERHLEREHGGLLGLYRSMVRARDLTDDAVDVLEGFADE